MVTLYCEETPELKLGPGTTGSWEGHQPGQDVIVFARGFAEFDAKQYPDWQEWMSHPGTPTIRIIDDSTGEGLSSEPHVCPIDGRPFKSDFALTGHMRTHAPKGAAK